MKIKRMSLLTNRNIIDRNFGLFKILDEKEKIIKINLQDYSNTSMNLTIIFIKENKKIETKKRIEEINITKNSFMKSLNVCEDVKRNIYSFL